MHPGAVDHRREERVAQMRGGDPSMRDYAAYVPVGNAVTKLDRWRKQGAQIDYLSSHRKPEDVAKDASMLKAFAFPAGRVLARERGESYGNIAGREMPDVLIQDDCESIGGSGEMTYQQIGPELRPRIKSIVVREFEGIDHLPDSLQELLALEP